MTHLRFILSASPLRLVNHLSQKLQLSIYHFIVHLSVYAHCIFSLYRPQSRYIYIHLTSPCSATTLHFPVNLPALSLQWINTSLCLFLSFFLPISVLHTNRYLYPDKNCSSKYCSFLSCRERGQVRVCQQIVHVQWIAAQESITWGLCKWTEQGQNRLQSPKKSCFLTHLLKRAGKLTVLDLTGWILNGSRWRQLRNKGCPLHITAEKEVWKETALA